MVLFIAHRTDNILSSSVKKKNQKTQAFVFSISTVFPMQVKSKAAHVTIIAPKIM